MSSLLKLEGVPVPKEPIILAFYPERGADMEVRTVFGDEVARSVWLMVRPGCLIGDDFSGFCTRAAARIRKSPPKDPQDLYVLLRLVSMDAQAYFPGSYEEHEAFMTRLFEAVTGARPIRYKTIELGSPEHAKWKRLQRKRGFWKGVLGELPAGAHSPSFRNGYHKGVQLRNRILESASQSANR